MMFKRETLTPLFCLHNVTYLTDYFARHCQLMHVAAEPTCRDVSGREKRPSFRSLDGWNLYKVVLIQCAHHFPGAELGWA